MNITQRAQQFALDLIKRFEGCRLKAYTDVVGVWTIGYGATGPDIVAGLIWTQEQADADLAKRIDEFQAQMAAHITIQPTDHQMAALTSLCYNIGIHAFLGSTVLRKLNGNDPKAAANAFLAWDHAGGNVVQALLWRRQQEQHFFLQPD